MNKAEFRAITMIANKMNWQNQPVVDTVETIKQMVRNQQALELDTIGECDDDEETLLSIALWEVDKIVSTMYVSSYQNLVMWGVYNFCDNMGITPACLTDMITFHNRVLPEIVEEEEMAKYDAYCDAWENSYC